MKKIFVIGPNKCATGSIHQFFKSNGLSSIHWDEGKLAKRMVSNISCGLSPIDGYENYDCFLDFYLTNDDIFISPLLLRSYLIRCFPDAIFVLNTRNFNAWEKSRATHDNGSFMTRMRSCMGESYSASTEYHAYNNVNDLEIKSLHIFDLAKQNKFERLAAFLQTKGFEINFTNNFNENVSAKLYR
jgi:hypothetical protein